MISVLDYGVGNLGSILNMIRRAGGEAELVSDADGVRSASRLLLPGVGHFDEGMSRLEASGMAQPLVERAGEGVPILGICLGMQMLMDGSDEGERSGLSLIEGRSERFAFGDQHSLKIPHMGWSHVRPLLSSRLVDGLDADARFYFVHSYHVVPKRREDVLAVSEYGGEFVSMVHRDNVMGAQFHPEKSHRFGMILLGNFGKL